MGAENLLVSEEQIAQAMAVASRADQALAEVRARCGRFFTRCESRKTALDYMRGLCSQVERRNGWTLSEQAGRTTSYALQDLRDRSTWDAEQVRDAVRAFAIEHLGDPEAVLIGEETGFIIKGRMSAGTLYEIMRVLHWSHWRRRSPKRAPVSHYAARGFLDP